MNKLSSSNVNRIFIPSYFVFNNVLKMYNSTSFMKYLNIINSDGSDKIQK